MYDTIFAGDRTLCCELHCELRMELFLDVVLYCRFFWSTEKAEPHRFWEKIRRGRKSSEGPEPSY